jgi:hypothetical protein
VIGDRVAQLPATGWPYGMFGCRDALILTLVAAGLTYAEVSELRRADPYRCGDELVIEGRRQWRLNADAAGPRCSPVAVYARWARVQGLLDRFPSTRMLAHYFEHSTADVAPGDLPVLEAKAAGQPLIVSIDRWGYTPLVATPMAAQSVAAVTRAHLAGRSPSHRPRTPLRRAGADTTSQPVRDAPIRPAPLDGRYYQRGVQARRLANTQLSSVGDILEDVNNRAERLLEELAAIVGDRPESSDDVV